MHTTLNCACGVRHSQLVQGIYTPFRWDWNSRPSSDGMCIFLIIQIDELENHQLVFIPVFSLLKETNWYSKCCRKFIVNGYYIFFSFPVCTISFHLWKTDDWVSDAACCSNAIMWFYTVLCVYFCAFQNGHKYQFNTVNWIAANRIS